VRAISPKHTFRKTVGVGIPEKWRRQVSVSKIQTQKQTPSQGKPSTLTFKPTHQQSQTEQQQLNKRKTKEDLRNMTIEVDLKEIKDLLSKLNKKIDVLIEDRDTLSLMALTEKSLKNFLENEPDLYSIKDIKVSYN
jgi:hypothetical protein